MEPIPFIFVRNVYVVANEYQLISRLYSIQLDWIR